MLYYIIDWSASIHQFFLKNADKHSNDSRVRTLQINRIEVRYDLNVELYLKKMIMQQNGNIVIPFIVPNEGDK